VVNVWATMWKANGRISVIKVLVLELKAIELNFKTCLKMGATHRYTRMGRVRFKHLQIFNFSFLCELSAYTKSRLGIQKS
jgi:hypothetical protein